MATYALRGAHGTAPYRPVPQVVDDILDITATTEELGKTAGKDLASAKTTYPSLVGLERSREVRAAGRVAAPPGRPAVS